MPIFFGDDNELSEIVHKEGASELGCPIWKDRLPDEDTSFGWGFQALGLTPTDLWFDSSDCCDGDLEILTDSEIDEYESWIILGYIIRKL